MLSDGFLFAERLAAPYGLYCKLYWFYAFFSVPDLLLNINAEFRSSKWNCPGCEFTRRKNKQVCFVIPVLCCVWWL